MKGTAGFNTIISLDSSGLHLLATGQGLYESTDRGNTWIRLTSPRFTPYIWGVDASRIPWMLATTQGIWVQEP